MRRRGAERTARRPRSNVSAHGWRWRADRRAGYVITTSLATDRADRNWRWTRACGHVARGQSGGSAVGVADEGIRDRRRWEQAVDCSDDDDEVDVEAGGTGECARGETGTDATLAWWRHLELGEKRRAELAAVHRRTDGVEVAEPVEDTFDLLVSGTLGVVELLEGTAPDPPLDLLAAPGRPLVPGRGWRPGDRASPAGRSRTSPALRRRRRSGRRVRARPPRGAVRARRRRPGVVSSGRRGRRLRRGSTRSQAAVCSSSPSAPRAGTSARRSNRSRRRSPRRSTSSRSMTSRGTRRSTKPRSGPAVPLDLGDVEVVLDESCVRSLRRPQHGHPTERRAGAAGVEHRPDGEPDLVVGVGGGDHLDGGRLCQWRDDGRQLRTPTSRARALPRSWPARRRLPRRR